MVWRNRRANKGETSPRCDTTASLPEKPEQGGGSNVVEKQEALPFPIEKAALKHTGNFPSESYPALESRLVILLRVRSADLISWKLFPTFRSGLNQHSFLVCKVKDVLSLSLLFSFHWIFTSSRRYWHQHLGVITWPSSLDVSQGL